MSEEPLKPVLEARAVALDRPRDFRTALSRVSSQARRPGPLAEMSTIAQTPAVLRDGDRKVRRRQLAPGSRAQRKVMPRPRIELSPATPNNIGTIRRLCSILFPVVYSSVARLAPRSCRQ